jgi:hypothetical protein
MEMQQAPDELMSYMQRLREEKGEAESLTEQQLCWVKLQDLMWVLQPEELYHRVVMGCHAIHPYTFNPQDTDGKWVCVDGVCQVPEHERNAEHHFSTCTVSEEHHHNHCRNWYEALDQMNQDASGKLLKSFKAQQKLAQYYEAQLKMFAEMMLERNYLSIYAFERMFSFEMLFNALQNVSLPDSTRACFAKMMTNLYVILKE